LYTYFPFQLIIPFHKNEPNQANTTKTNTPQLLRQISTHQPSSIRTIVAESTLSVYYHSHRWNINKQKLNLISKPPNLMKEERDATEEETVSYFNIAMLMFPEISSE